MSVFIFILFVMIVSQSMLPSLDYNGQAVGPFSPLQVIYFSYHEFCDKTTVNEKCILRKENNPRIITTFLFKFGHWTLGK